MLNELKPCPFCGDEMTIDGTADDMYYRHIFEGECFIGDYDFDKKRVELWNTRASPWTPIIEKQPTDHHPGYLVRGLDDIPHKAFWNDDHWIFDGARLEANAFIDWMEIPE